MDESAPNKAASNGTVEVYNDQPNVTDKHTAVSNLFSVLLALALSAVLGAALLFWFHYILSVGWIQSAVLSAAFAVTMAICSLVLKVVRCAFVVTFANLPSSQGRLVLLIFITSAVLSGPVANIAYNSIKVANATACVATTTVNQSEHLVALIKGPVNYINQQLHTAKLKWDSMSPQLDQKLSALESNMRMARNAINTLDSSFNRFQAVCNKSVGQAISDCGKSSDIVRAECLSIVGDFQAYIEKELLRQLTSKATDIFNQPSTDGGSAIVNAGKNFLCQTFGINCDQSSVRSRRQIGSLFPNPVTDKLNTMCKNADLSVVTKMCQRFGGFDVCNPLPVPDAFPRLQRTMEDVDKGIKWSRETLDFEIAQTADYLFDIAGIHTTTANPLASLQASNATWAELASDAAHKLHLIEMGVEVLKVLLTFSFIYLILVSWIYVHNWYASNSFDNVYITKTVRSIDQQTSAHVLPLQGLENRKFIELRSFFDWQLFMRQMPRTLLVLVIHVGIALMLFAFDHSTGQLLELVRQFFLTLKTDLPTDTSFAFAIVGNGPVAAFFNSFMGGISSFSLHNITVEFDHCFADAPSSVLPSYFRYTVYILYGFVLLLTILDQPATRCRMAIVTWFYPERDHERAVALIKQIGDLRSTNSNLQIEEAIEKVDERNRSMNIYGPLRNLQQVKNKNKCMLCGMYKQPCDAKACESSNIIHCKTCAPLLPNGHLED